MKANVLFRISILSGLIFLNCGTTCSAKLFHNDDKSQTSQTLQSINVPESPEQKAADDRLSKTKTKLDLAKKQLEATKALIKAAKADYKAAQADHKALQLTTHAQGLIDASGSNRLEAHKTVSTMSEPNVTTETDTSNNQAGAPTADTAAQGSVQDLSQTRLQQIDMNASSGTSR